MVKLYVSQDGVNFTEVSGVDVGSGITPIIKRQLTEAISEFKNINLLGLVEKEKSDRILYLKIFEDYFQNQNKNFINEISAVDVLKFREHLRKGIKDSSVERRFPTFRAFFKFCKKKKFILENPMDDIKMLDFKNEHFKPWTLENFNDFKKLLQDDEQKSLFDFMWLTGCRPIEVANLRPTDIDIEKKEIIFCCGKNKDIERAFPIDKEVDKILHNIKFYSDSVFKLNGRCINTDMLYQFTKHRLLKLGLDHLTTYGLRHAFANRLNESGFSTRDIQVLMGHSKIETTTIYVNPQRKYLIHKLDALYSS